MKNIKILIGASASGKSRYTSTQTDKVFSSDQIRKEIFGSLRNQDGQSHQKVFGILLSRILKYSDDAIYDATNLNRKLRAHFKGLAKDDKIHAIVFIEPLEILKSNNRKKTLDEQVPEEVIERMYKEMQIPKVGADCESYEVMGLTKFFNRTINFKELTSINSLEELFELLSNPYKKEMAKLFGPHDTPYHLESIDTHINMCIKNAGDDKILKLIALFHDLGKSITKDGGKYLNHQYVSAAYAAKAFSEVIGMENAGFIVEAIVQHMNAHQGLSEKVIRNNNLGDKLVDYIKLFAEIDSKSKVI